MQKKATKKHCRNCRLELNQCAEKIHKFYKIIKFKHQTKEMTE